MNKSTSVSASGSLRARLIRGTTRAPWAWRIRNAIRPAFWLGWLGVMAAKALSRLTGIPTLTSELSAILIRADGSRIDYGRLSFRLVTDNGVGHIVTDWFDNSTDVSVLNYHGVGTGTNAENATDSALQTESTTVLNPDSTRATGTKTKPSAKVLQTVGTPLFDGAAAITEHGIFSQAATGGGVLWDRSQFTAINVASGDSIQFTYQATFNSGG